MWVFWVFCFVLSWLLIFGFNIDFWICLNLRVYKFSLRIRQQNPPLEVKCHCYSMYYSKSWHVHLRILLYLLHSNSQTCTFIHKHMHAWHLYTTHTEIRTIAHRERLCWISCCVDIIRFCKTEELHVTIIR